MSTKNLLKSVFLAFFLACGLSVSNAGAELLASESFSYSGGGNTSGKGTATNGFAGAWSGSGNPKFQAVGLSMTGVLSAGGMAQYNSSENNANSRQFSAATVTALNSGTIYGSYLFSFIGTGSSNSPFTASIGLSNTNPGDNPINASSFEYAARTVNSFTSTVPGVSRSEAAFVPSDAAGNVTTGTTYLYLFTFNVSSGATDAWVLNQAQFTNFSASLDPLTLNSATVGTDSTNVSAKMGIAGGAAPANINWLSFDQRGGDSMRTSFDEIRFSNLSLTEAATGVPAAVPEPASTAFAIAATCGILALVRRRQRAQN